MNFRYFDDMPPGEGSMAKAHGNFTLTSQSSVYSLTFDEFQNTWSGLGKDVGSMNMDELLKNIWTAEESQAMTSVPVVVGGGGSTCGGNLQRQSSLTLPRTISQKTVDEVWKNLTKENTSSAKNGSGIEEMPRRQPTLGEVTLEEFLARAGVVREEPQHIERPFNCGFYGRLPREDNNGGFALGMLMGNQIADNKNMVSNQNQNAMFLGAGAVRPSQQQQQPLYPKPTSVTFASSMNLANNSQQTTLGSIANLVAASKPPLHDALVQNGGIGAIGLGTRVVTAASRSSTSTTSKSSEMITKNNVEASSFSPVPHSFGRGRRSSGALEKVVERRQRRMIKNRESAARSRARKQAYTLELEAEVAKLKEMNQELQKKQREIMQMQENQLLEKVKCQLGGKRFCLRRTLTGPW